MPNRLLRDGAAICERAQRQIQSVRAASARRRDRMIAAGELPHSAVRRMLEEGTGKPCPECGHVMARWCGRRVASLDHVIPISKGGTNALENLRVICNRCNSQKGNR